MPSKHFLVRVETRAEMPAAAASDRVALDAALLGDGFARRMTGSSGTEYHLPPGEYTVAGEFTRQEVVERVKRLAAGRRCAVLVTEAVAFAWSGLTHADPDETEDGIISRVYRAAGAE